MTLKVRVQSTSSHMCIVVRNGFVLAVGCLYCVLKAMLMPLQVSGRPAIILSISIATDGQRPWRTCVYNHTLVRRSLCDEADFQDLAHIGCTILDLSDGLRSHLVDLLLLHEPLEGQGTASQAKVEGLCRHKRNAVRLQGL